MAHLVLFEHAYMPGTDLQPGDIARSRCVLKANDQTASSVDF